MSQPRVPASGILRKQLSTLLTHPKSQAVVNYVCHTPGCQLCGILRKNIKSVQEGREPTFCDFLVVQTVQTLFFPRQEHFWLVGGLGLLPLEVTLLDLLSGTILWCVVVAVVVWGWGWFPTRDLAAKDAAAAAALNPFCRASAAAVAAACGLSL